MASETVEKILSAEKSMHKTEQSAKAKGEQLIADANKEAESIRSDAYAHAQEAAAALAKKNAEENEAIYHASAQASVATLLQFQSDIKGKMQAAIDATIKLLCE